MSELRMPCDETNGGRRAESEGVPPRTLVVGLGATGLSCVRHLRAQGEDVAAVDSRSAPPALASVREEFPEVALTLGEFPETLFATAERIVVSPGVSLEEPVIRRALEAGIGVCGDIELFARAVGDTPVVAITGSNGKSTVTTLVGRMVAADGGRVAVGGNLGPPALSLLGSDPPELYVLELSSFQLETTSSLTPVVAAVLNVSADHLDRYATVDAYARAKQRIFRGDGAMVLNRDDPRVAAMALPGRRVVEFTLAAPPADAFGVRRSGGVDWLCAGEERIVRADAVRIAGRHNVANALAALAVGSVLGLSREAMSSALATFPGLPHRCQLVGEANGVRWYDDSKATNVGATLAAIDGLGAEAPLVLIAGGDGKGADFSALREAVRGRVRAVVLIGRDAPLIDDALGGAAATVRAGDMREAVALARCHARAGDRVLLSPACASFDMYADYRERGACFAAAVREEISA